MRTPIVVLLVLLLMCAAHAAPTRGVLVSSPPAVVPVSVVEAELATVLPVLSDGGDWTKITVTLGVAYTIPQPNKHAWLCPDRVTGFLAQDEPGFQDKLRVGVMLDWTVIKPLVSVYVGGVSGIGYSAGVKADLLRTSF